MGQPLPRSAPRTQHVDPLALSALLDALEGNPGIEMHSLMVVRHGHVVAEGWWAPYTPERRQLLYSLSKSFTSTAAAFAASAGLLDLDDPLLAHFPELDGEVVDQRSRSFDAPAPSLDGERPHPRHGRRRVRPGPRGAGARVPPHPAGP